MDDSHLNAAQKRIQDMKEDLKRHDNEHLESFLEGLSNPEPPAYKKINGKVEPPLQKVTVKEGKNQYHVGNVFFTDDKSVSDVTLVAEKGEVEIYMADEMPKSPGNPMSRPILDVILLDLIPLWGAKFKAIKQRMAQINDVRSFAHNAPNSPEPRIVYGKNLTKLLNTKPTSTTTTTPNPLKRPSPTTTPIPRHPSNKRKRIGLASIPDSVKSDIFTRLPSSLKTDLFNTIAAAACPNFDNLVMAAWNVVSVYQLVGTEFGELHKAVLQLRGVLVEFDGVYRRERGVGGKVDREGRGEVDGHRNGDAGVGDEGRKSEAVSTVVQEPIEEVRVARQESPLFIAEQESSPLFIAEQTPTPLFIEETLADKTPRKSASPELQIVPYDRTAHITEPGLRPTLDRAIGNGWVDVEEQKKAYVAKMSKIEGKLMELGVTPTFKPNTGRTKTGSRSNKGTPEAQRSNASDGSRRKKESRGHALRQTENNLDDPQWHDIFAPRRGPQTTSSIGHAKKSAEQQEFEGIRGFLSPSYDTETSAEPKVLEFDGLTRPCSSVWNYNMYAGDGTSESSSSHNTPTNNQAQEVIWLGNSKLGRPKNSGNTSDKAPEAPMAHTVSKNSDQDGGDGGNGSSYFVG